VLLGEVAVEFLWSLGATADHSHFFLGLRS
jgi:hypothetical protein